VKALLSYAGRRNGTTLKPPAELPVGYRCSRSLSIINARQLHCLDVFDKK